MEISIKTIPDMKFRNDNEAVIGTTLYDYGSGNVMTSALHFNASYLKQGDSIELKATEQEYVPGEDDHLKTFSEMYEIALNRSLDDYKANTPSSADIFLMMEIIGMQDALEYAIKGAVKDGVSLDNREVIFNDFLSYCWGESMFFSLYEIEEAKVPLRQFFDLYYPVMAERVC